LPTSGGTRPFNILEELVAAAEDDVIRSWYKDKIRDLNNQERALKRTLSILDAINHEAEKRGIDLNG
jgi:hypothetical protein